MQDTLQTPDHAAALREWHERYQAIMDSDRSALEVLWALKALGPAPELTATAEEK
ncbi:hypothetical protein IGS68_29310 (plasmid) [Skermanella sp. TT6]|uniref:Uncharacterized protein n=1 Tax=Skermanella cutis TaxID=2775420 RepID=A0ABX7BFP2_9PROT|nr:hypothetical protein [Skermanella sp. TT6]QQP93221.1 hypothetical protein IGS68_29310 [Skermanella sp. TT6]